MIDNKAQTLCQIKDINRRKGWLYNFDSYFNWSLAPVIPRDLFIKN